MSRAMGWASHNRQSRRPVLSLDFHQPRAGFATLADYYHAWGLRCCTVEEFSQWAGGEPGQLAANGYRATFCTEGDMAWCTAKRHAGDCVLSDVEFSTRVLAGRITEENAQ